VKLWLENLFARLVSAAGGRPEVVLPLYHGLQKAATGRQELLRKQSRRKVTLSAAALHVILLTVTALGSVFLAFFMLLNPSDFHPHLGVLVLVGAHWLLAVNMITSLAGPSLLVDDDLLTMGWWPVTRRELLLARLGTILKPALQVTLALGTVPLIVYAVTGRPPVLSAVVLAVGLLIQTVGVTFGTAVILALVVRLGGRRRAQRLAALTADGSSFMYLWLLMVVGQRLGPWMGAHLNVVYCLPPFWFTAFGDLWAGPLNRAMAILGVVFSFAMVTVGLRLLVPSGQGQQAQPVEKRPSRWHWSSLISALLWPMMPGREGWVVRRLLESHLREDWRFVGGMLTVPVMLAFMFFGLDEVVPRDLDPEAIRFTALTAIHHSHFLTLMAASVIFLASYSSTPRALWIVGLADLDAGRLLAAQRGMIRGVVVAPVLVLYALKASLMGAEPRVVVLDLLVLGLQVEIIITVMQSLVLVMPFSLAYTNDQSARRVALGFLAAGVALVFVAMNFLYAAFAVARLAVWVGLPLVLLLLLVWNRRRLAGRRLRMDSVLVS
jgi:hypothetical protein